MQNEALPKLLLAIASGTDAKASGHDIILIAAADEIEKRRAPERIYDATKHAIHLKAEADAMHGELLRQCETLMDAKAGSPEAKELDRLSKIVADYEEVRWSLEKATVPNC